MFGKKKFYTRTIIRVKGFHKELKFQFFFLIYGDPWNKEREGDLKDTERNIQNAALNVDLFKLLKIPFVWQTDEFFVFDKCLAYVLL